MKTRRPPLGQNFLRDPNLLDAIIRDAGVRPNDVVLEVGGGEGALTERLSAAVGRLWVVELDRRLEPKLGPLAERAGNVTIVWGDAMRLELAGLDPAPSAIVSNLPYSIATPLLIRTIAELPSVSEWTVLVQREIADRLRADPGSRTYGAPSVVVQLSCEIEMVRSVDRAVFDPAPRVDSALLRLSRTAPAPPPALVELIRGAFAHRRKALPRSLEHVEPGARDRAANALEAIGMPRDARAESLSPAQFEQLATAIEERR